MAGILANSASETMTSGDTAVDNARAGYVVNEQITLSTTPSGSTYIWSLAKPSGATSRSNLSDATLPSVTFVPDFAGTWTVTCVVDGTTTYVLRLTATAIAITSVANAHRFSPVENNSVPAPATGVTLFCSTDDSNQLRLKRTNGSVVPLDAASAFLQGGNSFGATATIGTNDANALSLETGGVERVRITTSGELQVNGSGGTAGQVLTSQGAGSPAIWSTGVANTFSQNGNSFGTLATIGTNDANDLAFETNGTEKARLLSNGNFLVGGGTYTAPFFSEKLGLYEQATLPAGTISRRSASILADYEAPAGGSTSNPVALGVLSQLVATGGSANVTAGAFRAVSYAVNNNNTITGIRAEAFLLPVGGNVGTVFRLRPLTAQVSYGSGTAQVHVDAVDTISVVGGASGRTTTPANPRTSRRHNGIAIGDMGSLATQESVALSIQSQSPSSVFSLGIECFAPVAIGTGAPATPAEMLGVSGSARFIRSITAADDNTQLANFDLDRSSVSAGLQTTTAVQIRANQTHGVGQHQHQVEGALIEAWHSGRGTMTNVYGQRVVAAVRPEAGVTVGNVDNLIGSVWGLTHGFAGSSFVTTTACLVIPSPQGRTTDPANPRTSNNAYGISISNQGDPATLNAIGVDIQAQTSSPNINLGLRSQSPVVVGTSNVAGTESLRVEAGGARIGGLEFTVGVTSALSLNNSGGAINIGTAANNQQINIGTNGQRSINVGNGLSGTQVNLTAPIINLSPVTALQVSGSAGTAGQVLRSNGPSSPATWSSFPAGTFSLSAGAATVANTAVTASSVIIANCTSSSNQGHLQYTLNPGVGFSVTSTNAADVSSYRYAIIN